MHLVIIGGVAAGTKAAARARRCNPDINITLFQDEAEVAYTACGQPYFLSGLIADRNALIIRKAEDFAKDRINVHTQHRVTQLDSQNKSVTVVNRKLQQQRQISFDRLILATGARSNLPDIPGIDLPGVVTLRSIEELNRFHAALQQLKPKTAIIAGSGYIGLELAETLRAYGITVTIIDHNPRVFSRMDVEMSQYIHDYLCAKNIQLLTEDHITAIQGDAGVISSVQTHRGMSLQADLVVLALGITPNVELAQNSGINLGPTGAIKVNEQLQTNVDSIYAAGDCVESMHRITHQPVWAPLGDIANLQGRIAGENAAGGHAIFPGVLSTAILKSFTLNIGMTGLTEADAIKAGYQTVSTVINARDKARYYPETQNLNLKFVADATNGRLLGAQAVGVGCIDKTIDIAATALLGKLTCFDLENADFAYAPPFSPVLSPVIIAATTIAKKIT